MLSKVAVSEGGEGWSASKIILWPAKDIDGHSPAHSRDEHCQFAGDGTATSPGTGQAPASMSARRRQITLLASASCIFVTCSTHLENTTTSPCAPIAEEGRTDCAWHLPILSRLLHL